MITTFAMSVTSLLWQSTIHFRDVPNKISMHQETNIWVQFTYVLTRVGLVGTSLQWNQHLLVPHLTRRWKALITVDQLSSTDPGSTLLWMACSKGLQMDAHPSLNGEMMWEWLPSVYVLQIYFWLGLCIRYTWICLDVLRENYHPLGENKMNQFRDSFEGIQSSTPVLGG